MADREGERGPVSFSFTRTASKLRLREAEPSAEEEAVSGVDQGEILSVKPREKPRELIIPLIQKNRWHRPEPGDKVKEEKPGAKQEDSEVLSRAVQELIEESQRYQQKWTEGSRDDPDLSIPLLKQNQAPSGFEDGDKINVELRPESSTDADYESVPVDAYGLAMLRGMGWKEGEGIGRTFKQDVKPLEHQLRPKGLGLGADRSIIRDLEEPRPQRAMKPGEEKRPEEPTGLVAGSLVQIEKGPHKCLYGKIEGLDTDNARVLVKLALGGKVVTVSQYYVQFVKRREYERYSKDLSRLSKAHKEAELREEEHAAEQREILEKQEKEAERSSGRERGREGGHKDRERDHQQTQDRKRKHEADSESVHSSKVGRSLSETASRDACWLRTDLFVRFIDKHYKGGKYYNSKVTIEDVLGYDSCVCRTEEGRLLEGIKQSMLETVIPKRDSDYVMVVLGQHKGLVGRILRRDKDRCRAAVQLQREDEQVLKIDYDSICHYVGATDDD
ncbi:G-patch domain and KOW motifs-containing protein isoform X2 [Scyliorhinus torazame]|uniref:G-patch domain and KOW motifs-containing protein isoform X2 n=1 Tax=Scyliorhinus torazame TaxID=75743 RepID=UPI003B5B3FA0